MAGCVPCVPRRAEGKVSPRPDEDKQLLPTNVERSPTAYVVGGGFISWTSFWCCVFPILLVIVAVSIVTGQWYFFAVVSGVLQLYVIILLILMICFRPSFQLWALQRPNNCIVRLFLPPVEVIDSARLGDARAALERYVSWGPNFCAAGQVWLCSYEDVAKALTSPQARTYNLGEHPLVPQNLPGMGHGDRCSFLLALSDKLAGGMGDHEAFYACLKETIFSPAAKARESDPVSQRLLDQLAKDYQSMDPTEFWNSGTGGNQGFWIKYLHHVFFDLNIDSEPVLATLRGLLGSQMALTHYLMPLGYIIRFDSVISSVGLLYETSPVLANFKEEAKYNFMTKHELCSMMVAIMRIAGVQGSQMFVFVATGGSSHGYIPVDTRDYWDSLNLDDETAVRRYALECTRLSAPVTVSHRVATEDFTCKIRGKDYTFPKGTKIGIPLCLAMVDKAKWGEDAFEFNPKRPNLEECFLGFNSVGGKTAGRECPAKDFVLRSQVKVLQRLGKTRPRKPAPPKPAPVTTLPTAKPFIWC